MIGIIRARVANALRRRLGFPDQPSALRRLRNSGFNPSIVFDVGASYGVFVDEVSVFWPRAEIHCFEPEPEYIARLSARAEKEPRIHVCDALVGAVTTGEVEYHFHLGASSILATSADDAESTSETLALRRAKMVSLSEYCESRGVAPNLLKIDVQGYELEVLKGAGASLSAVEVVLTEVNHIDIYQGAPLAGELIHYMTSHGFALHDICNFMRRPLDQALWQTDMIFVRHDSHLRSSRRWS